MLRFLLGCLSVYGVSGSGKSSLVSDVLSLLWSMLGSDAAVPGEFDALVGGEQLDKVIVIDQSPIGRTPRSNPSTYVKVWDDIRKLFTMLPMLDVVAGRLADFHSMSLVVAAVRAKGMGQHVSTWTFWLMSGLPVMCVVAPALPKTHSRFAGREKRCRHSGDGSRRGAGILADAPDIARKLQTLSDVGLDYRTLVSITDSFWWRGTTRQAFSGTCKAVHRQHALYSG